MMAFPISDQNINSNSSTMTYPTWDKFVASYFHQCFSRPDSTVYYIMKNPHSSKVYQKLIQSCKYFFIKNPILVFHCLQIDDNGWKICSKESNDCNNLEFTQKINVSIKALTRCKVWIQDGLYISSSNSKCASDLFGTIYQCDAEVLLFRNQHISFEEFLLCAKHAICVSLEKVVINSDANSEIPLEDIISNLPKMHQFVYEYDNVSKNATSDTMAKLLQIPHFKNITNISVMNISEKFDIDEYYKYYKNSSAKLTFFFKYRNPLAEEYIEKLKLINNEILEIGLQDRITSLIIYREQVDAEYNALLELYKKSLESFE